MKDKKCSKKKLRLISKVLVCLIGLSTFLFSNIPISAKATDFPDQTYITWLNTDTCYTKENMPSYCADLGLLADTAQKIPFYKQKESLDYIDYVMYHGADGPEYKAHKTIMGYPIKSDAIAHRITQFACYRCGYEKTGSGMKSDGICVFKEPPLCGHGLVNNSFTNWRKCTQEEKDATNKLCECAMAYEAKGGTPEDPEYRCSILYKSNDSDYQRFVSFNTQGKLKLIKTSSIDSISKHNELYDLTNTYFHIYKGESWESAQDTNKWFVCTKENVKDNKVYATARNLENTDEDFINLDFGVYWVAEEAYKDKTNKGFTKCKPIKVVVDKSVNYVSNTDANTVENEPIYDPVELLLVKHIADSADDKQDEQPCLEGAEFTVKYFDTFTKYNNNSYECPQTQPKRVWVFKTDAEGQIKLNNEYKVDGDDLYQNNDSSFCIPRGTITIQETSVPEGYTPDQSTYVRQIKGAAQDDCESTFETLNISNYVKRADISFNKINQTTMQRMSHIPFKLTNKTTGESHILLTDKNGQVNTSSEHIPHSTNTNANDKTVDDELEFNEELLEEECGVWFKSKSNPNSEVNDSLGALPYGIYTLEEIRCKNNKDHNLMKFDINISKDKYHYCLGTVDNKPIKIKSNLTDKYTGKKSIQPSENTVLCDEIELANLNEDKNYCIKAKLHLVKEDKVEPLTINGSEATTSKNFTAGSSEEKITLEYDFNSTDLCGQTLVSYTYLYEDDKFIASHEDPLDKAQTVSFIELKTHAQTESKSKYLNIGPEEKIYDKVSFCGLIPDNPYVLEGKIYAISGDNKELVAKSTHKFTAQSISGTETVEFSLDTTNLKGKKLVVVEELCFNDKKIAEHCDFNDEEQTLYIPQLTTLALSKDGKKCLSENNNAELVDTVNYVNLEPGVTYKAVSYLVQFDRYAEVLEPEKSLEDDETDVETSDNKEEDNTAAEDESNKNKSDEETVTNNEEDTNEVNSDDEEANEDEKGLKKIDLVEQEFTPEESSGSLCIPHMIDTVVMDGPFVVCEEIWCDETNVINHIDLNCEEQTVYTPKIDTLLCDSENNKEILDKHEINLVDHITFEDIPNDFNYDVCGTLHLVDKEGNDLGVIEETKPEISTQYSPDTQTPNEITLAYDIDAHKLTGHKLVSFIEIRKDGVIYAEHKDLADKRQTVQVIKNRTLPKTVDYLNHNYLKILIASIIVCACFILRKYSFVDLLKPKQNEIF